MAKDTRKDKKSVKKLDDEIAALRAELEAKAAAKQQGVDEMLLLLGRVLLRAAPQSLRKAYLQCTTPNEKKKLDALGFIEFIDVVEADHERKIAEAKEKAEKNSAAARSRAASALTTPTTAPPARPVASSPVGAPAPAQPVRQS